MVEKTPEQVLLYGGTAGDAFDTCYHQLCDDLTNINDKGYAEHKDAAVHAILTFAQTTSAVNGTDNGSSGFTKESDWRGDKLVRQPSQHLSSARRPGSGRGVACAVRVRLDHDPAGPFGEHRLERSAASSASA